MPLDICTPPDIDKLKAQEALATTTAWLKRSKNAWTEAQGEWKGSLFGIIQGNFYEDLRRQAVEEVGELDLPGIAIGGLSVGEKWREFLHYLRFTAELLPTDRPRYVMGIGTPEYILEAVAAGIDIFDCVFPTRTARTGMVFTKRGTLNLKKEWNAQVFEPIDTSCGCPVCARYTRAYLRHLFKANEILGIMLATRHNLEFLQRLMVETRRNIENGSFETFKRSYIDEYASKLSAT
jgi:queuine tRNA-ribosyltransferase